MTHTQALSLEDITVGDTLRIGRSKVDWTVVRVTLSEQANILHPAGVALARDTGHHRHVGVDRLEVLTRPVAVL